MSKKYFFDTEFLEGKQKKMFGYTKPTIDLISIGMVCEDGRKYYSVCKDFNLKEAWNRFQTTEIGVKEYWIRYNVLHPIYLELIGKHHLDTKKAYRMGFYGKEKNLLEFNLKNLKYLINLYGQSHARIANDICGFIYGDDCGGSGMSPIELSYMYEPNEELKPEFFCYYGAHDWTVFCWIFGSMMTLPKGFPIRFTDLKQIYEHVQSKCIFDNLRNHKDYPKNKGEHLASCDADWNFELYKFLQTI